MYMQKKRKYISLFLCMISLFLLVISSLPHYHHDEGGICFKKDLAEHPIHHHADDTCCNDQCIAQIQPLHPSGAEKIVSPDYFLILTLFTVPLIEWLLQPQQRVLKNQAYHYLERLHSSPVTSHNQLRAPPVLSAIL